MALSPGTQIGPYQIVAAIGAGGMGEVYRAHDSKLDRDVALKVLPDAMAADPDRLARFEREAKVLATLNHPHIAQIFGAFEGVSPSGSTIHALAMELVEGFDLAEIIRKSPLPLDDALAVADQVADALEAAHEHGIIHRDLKPANVKRRPDGTVKVLDFGLAKLGDQDEADPAGTNTGVALTNSPTVASPAQMTSAGVILGTAAYMSPEQARGRPVDKRADVWAFGCLLYEMLTARRAFEGRDVVDVLGAVIHTEPNLDLLPAGTPVAVRTTIAACLQKDPRKRMRDIGDVRMALAGAFAPIPTASMASTPAMSRASAIVLGLVAMAAGAIGVAVWFANRPAPPAVNVTHFQVPEPKDVSFGGFFAISPDGRRLAFQARNTLRQGPTDLWVHAFDTGRSQRIERAGSITGSPFWSADSRFIGYSNAGRISRIEVTGGPPEEIARITGYAGGAWTPDGTLVLGSVQGPLVKVPAGGGEPIAVTTLDAAREETGHTNPTLLPDGRHFFYLRVSRQDAKSGIFLGSLDVAPSAQSLERVVPATVQALFAPGPAGGHLLYVRDGALMAHEVDPESYALKGLPVEVVDRVAINPATYAQFMPSAVGSIAYRPPEPLLGGVPTWFDRTRGSRTPVISTLTTPALYPRLSPDGARLAITLGDSLWVYDLGGRPPIRLAVGRIYSPHWTRDGRQLVFEPTGASGLHMLPADGSVSASRQVTPIGHYHAHGFSADGREIVAVKQAEGPEGDSGWDILRVPFGVPGEPVPVVAGPANEGLSGAALSHDGRWLAYVANTTGTPEVWVRSYPDGGAPVRISPNRGVEPVWARDGRELFYLEGTKLMVSKVSGSSGTFTFETPTVVLDEPIVLAPQPPSYDVAADGRILLLKPVAIPPSPIEVIMNWRSQR